MNMSWTCTHTMLISYQLCSNRSLMQPLITPTHFLISFRLRVSLLCLFCEAEFLLNRSLHQTGGWFYVLSTDLFIRKIEDFFSFL